MSPKSYQEDRLLRLFHPLDRIRVVVKAGGELNYVIASHTYWSSCAAALLSSGLLSFQFNFLFFRPTHIQKPKKHHVCRRCYEENVPGQLPGGSICLFSFCSLILSTLRSEVTVQINVFHYIDGKLGALWTLEYESEFEEQYMEIWR